MPPYLTRLFTNDLVDAFSSELPSAVWFALSRELEFVYLLSGQRLPRQGASLRDVYFPASATIAVYAQSLDGDKAIGHIAHRGMTPLGEFMSAEIGVPCQFEVERPGVAFSVRAEKLCEIASSSDYLHSLITASEHALRFKVFADMSLVRSLSGELIRKLGHDCR
jgi:hypothetical protein